MERWQAELALDARADLGEGPLWDGRTSELLWVDIMAGLVHRFDPAAGTDDAIDVGQPVGAVVPRAAGGYALAVREGFALLDSPCRRPAARRAGRPGPSGVADERRRLRLTRSLLGGHDARWTWFPMPAACTVSRLTAGWRRCWPM